MPDPDQRHLGRSRGRSGLTYGNFLLERGRARPSTSASNPRTAGSAACRSATSPASRSSCARSSTGPPPSSSTASTPSRSRARSSRGDISLRLAGPDQLIRLLEAGADLSRPARDPDRRRAGAAGRPARGARPRRDRRPDLRPDRDLLPGDHPGAGRRGAQARLGRTARCSRRTSGSRTARSSSRARPSPASAIEPTAGSAPATSAASTRRASSTSPGRTSEVIVTGGENVMPGRGRGRCCCRHPAVADAAVVGRAGPRVAGGRDCALVVLADGRGDRRGGAALALRRHRWRPTRSRSGSSFVASLPRTRFGQAAPRRAARAGRSLASAAAWPPTRSSTTRTPTSPSLEGKTVAILGYGSQGHAHALNLKDSGVDVVVGLRPDSSSRADAEAEGLEVLDVADAASRGDIVMILLPGREAGRDLARGDRGRDRRRATC